MCNLNVLPNITAVKDKIVTSSGSPNDIGIGMLIPKLTGNVTNPPTVWDYTEGRFQVEVRALGSPHLRLAYLMRFWEYNCFDLSSQMQTDRASYDDAIPKHRRRYDSRALGFPEIFESFMEQDPQARQHYTYAMERVTLYAMYRWTRSWTHGVAPAAKIKLWSIDGKFKDILAGGYIKQIPTGLDPGNVTVAS